MILERQCEGITIAKKVGKYKVGKKISVPDIDLHYILLNFSKILRFTWHWFDY